MNTNCERCGTRQAIYSTYGHLLCWNCIIPQEYAAVQEGVQAAPAKIERVEE